MIFNELSLKGVASTGRKYVLSDESRPGLAIKVSAFGSALYYYRYKKQGQRREVALGTDFVEATALYKVLRDQTAKGGALDTVPESIANDALFKPGITLPILIQSFYRFYVKTELSEHSHRTYQLYLNSLEAWALDNARSFYYGRCSVLEGRNYVKTYLASIVRDRPILCNRMRSCYSSMFKWGCKAEEELVQDNPIYNMPAGLEKPKSRMLDPAELEAFLPVLTHGQYDELTKDALRLQLLTLMRPGEALLLKARNVQKSLAHAGRLNLVFQPDEVKNGAGHMIPLSPQAQEIVERLVDGKKPKDKLVRTSTWGLRQVCMRACKRADVTVCTPHDLRRTAATLCGQLGVPAHLIPMLLNHSPQGVTNRHYNLFQYEEERRAALTKLGDYIESLGLKA